jgi:hypothetical protein
MEDQEKVTYFAETDFRNKKTKFGIKKKDRTRHMYIIGKTGMGKSTLLENLAVQDIQNGEGVAFIDPHGSSAEALLEYVPEHRIKDVIYFAPFDLDNPISFNVLENVDRDKHHLIAGGLMNAFKKIWADAFSGRMEYILNNTLLALLDYPGASLLGVNRMYSDKDFRKKIVDNIQDPSVKAFWTDEYAKYSEKFAMEATAAIQNKIGQFTGNPLIRNLIGQPKSSFDFRDVMDKRKILIINLSKGKMGPENMRLVGGMIVTKLYLAAMSRADKKASELKNMPSMYLYVDEFQNFANESFAEILSESRKYNLALTVANQYIDQMTEEVRSAILGNVGSMVTFRIGAPDADILEKEFAPYFTAEDLVSLGFGQIYLKLMIDGIGSQPFSALTIPPIPEPEKEFSAEIIASSRAQFSRKREDVEREIAEWHKPTITPKASPSNTNQTSINTGNTSSSYNQNKPVTGQNVALKTDYKQNNFPPKKPFEIKNTNTQNPAPKSVEVKIASPIVEVKEPVVIKKEVSLNEPIKTNHHQDQVKRNTEKPVNTEVKNPIYDLHKEKLLDKPESKISLKDAINKAMEEKRLEAEKLRDTQTKKQEEQKETHKTAINDDTFNLIDKVKKEAELKEKLKQNLAEREIPEDVLRKLLDISEN